MLDAIVVMFKRTTSVIGRVNEDALDPAGEFLFESFEGEEVVAEDEAVIEQVVVGDAVLGVVGPLRVLLQNPRLQPRSVLLTDPGEFEFRAIRAHSPFFVGISGNRFAVFRDVAPTNNADPHRRIGVLRILGSLQAN